MQAGIVSRSAAAAESPRKHGNTEKIPCSLLEHRCADLARGAAGCRCPTDCFALPIASRIIGDHVPSPAASGCAFSGLHGSTSARRWHYVAYWSGTGNSSGVAARESPSHRAGVFFLNDAVWRLGNAEIGVYEYVYEYEGRKSACRVRAAGAPVEGFMAYRVVPRVSKLNLPETVIASSLSPASDVSLAVLTRKRFVARSTCGCRQAPLL